MSWLPKSRTARRRLTVVAAAAPIVLAAAGLTAFAMRDAATFFYSPSQAREKHVPAGRTVRIGGLVEVGTVRREADGVLRFAVTDRAVASPVLFRGEPPDLFREGQGVVAQGSFRADGVFEAREVLAKHDERYMPKEVTDSLKKSGQWRPEVSPATASVASR